MLASGCYRDLMMTVATAITGLAKPDVSGTGIDVAQRTGSTLAAA